MLVLAFFTCLPAHCLLDRRVSCALLSRADLKQDRSKLFTSFCACCIYFDVLYHFARLSAVLPICFERLLEQDYELHEDAADPFWSAARFQ